MVVKTAVEGGAGNPEEVRGAKLMPELEDAVKKLEVAEEKSVGVQPAGRAEPGAFAPREPRVRRGESARLASLALPQRPAIWVVTSLI